MNELTLNDWLRVIGCTYVLGFFVGAYAVALMLRILDKADDRRDIAGINSMLHGVGWSRTTLMIFGGIVWPMLPIWLVMGLRHK